MKKPNFFIIGAPKCGTTSLASWLGAHPLVFMSPDKEPHYFNEDTPRRITKLKEYEKLFKQATVAQRAIGEASTGYLLSATAVPNILRYNPNAKFIVMLRNPIDMAPSLHEQRLYQFVEDIADFEVAWQMQDQRRQNRQIPSGCNDPLHLQYGAYCKIGAQVERLLKIVKRDRSHFIFLDSLKLQPRVEWLSLLDFLEIPDDGRVKFPAENTAKVRKNVKLARWILRAGRIRRRLLGRHFQLGILNRANRATTVERARSSLSAAMKERLVDYFHEDIRLLSELVDRDLSAWLDPK